MAPPSRAAVDDPLAAWLEDDAAPAPVDALLAYTPADGADVERYCLALYHHLDGVAAARPPDAFDALWARSAQLDPERRLLKAVFDLSLLDVCYESLRHANLFGRWVRPRPQLAARMASSPCLRRFYDDGARRAQATTCTRPGQYAMDLVRNLLMMLFLMATIGAPRGLGPALKAAPRCRALLQAAAVAMALALGVWALRRALRLPRAPVIVAVDEYSAAVLRSRPASFLLKAIVYDLLDEIVCRWMGVFAFAFLLSLLDMALTHYVGSFIMIAAAVALISERCSPVAILTVCSLAAVTIVAQISNLSLLWRLGHLLNSASGWILAPFGRPPFDTFLASRPEFLTAVVLSQIRLPMALTLKPWKFGDFLLEPCHMLVSAFFWSIVFSDGLITALIARFVFSLVSVVLLQLLQGPISVQSGGRVHSE